MNEPEVVDIYDENKCKTGRTLIRHKEFLKPGEYIVACQAIILNSKREILISKRSEFKEKFPFMWECNGGAVLAGETSLDGVVREIKEELGIILDKEDGIYIKTAQNNYRFKDIYLFVKDIELEDIKFTDKEAIEAKWIDIDEFIKMLENGKFVPTLEFDENDYKKCLELLGE